MLLALPGKGWLALESRIGRPRTERHILTFSTALLLVAASAGLLAGRLQRAPGRAVVPWLTLSIVAMLALAGVAQWFSPTLLFRFERNACAIRSGEFYRLLTALWLQDGGVVGGVFNLVMALLLGSIAERLWDRRSRVILYFGAGLVTECVALWWQPVGAGNSIAWMGLAGGILAAGRSGARPRALMILIAIGLAAGAALVALRDIHGAALLTGAAIGLALPRAGSTTEAAG